MGRRLMSPPTRAEFDDLLRRVYCPSGAFADYLTYTPDSVTVHSTPAKTSALISLQFSPPTINHQPCPFRRLCLDPGHIGGEWAQLEERWFQRGADQPIAEAALNLTVARHLRRQLETAGFEICLTKRDCHPVADLRPGEFSRPAEIAARARKINEELKPDLTLCLHFNAAPWDDRHNLVADNRLLVLIHGNYLPAELRGDAQKLCLIQKLCERSHALELAVAEAVADALARTTGLPPVENADHAIRVGANPCVYARNLMANRLIHGPVVYLEPYYMNNRLVYQRLQLGDYAGEKEIEGRAYPSIFREYATAVATGLLHFCGSGTPAGAGRNC